MKVTPSIYVVDGENILEIDATTEPRFNWSDHVSHNKAKVSSVSFPSAAAAAATLDQSVSSVERVLISIHDLLEAKLRSDAQRRHEMDRDEQLMNEWLVAAAAIDRICFIALAVLLIAGSALFLILLFLQPQ